jgi:hypothetical protein
MAAEFTRLTHKRETTASSGGELYHLQFSLQATSPETFGYTLVVKKLHDFYGLWKIITVFTGAHHSKKKLMLNRMYFVSSEGPV